MSGAHIKIKMTGSIGTVEVDGQDLKCVRAFTITAKAGGPTTISLDLLPETIEFEVDGDAQIRDVTGLREKVRRFEFR